jgi:acetylornithine deacetylase/succinyl-diaminopimelate desuccinylase-like protein
MGLLDPFGWTARVWWTATAGRSAPLSGQWLKSVVTGRCYLSAMSETAAQGVATELLQTLIRNECVNDGTPESGSEVRNAELLAGFLEGATGEKELFAPIEGRTSVVARIEGSDPTAPTLCLMGHTDVVPVNPAGWLRDPFGGELIDGEVWGRGAIDMLNMTATMAVAFRQLAASGWRPRGTLVYFGVADEEAGGAHGARFMTENHWDAVGADFVLTEMGGFPVGDHVPRRVLINVAEKGTAWRRLRVEGTPGHGSMPFGSDNAAVKAAEIIRRLADYRGATAINDAFRAWVEGADLTDEAKAGLLNPEKTWATLESLPASMARGCHAMSHTTFSPNVVQGGQKTNMIPDIVDIDVDIRTLPGVSGDDVDQILNDLLGEFSDHVTVMDGSGGTNRESTKSPTDSALWEAVSSATQVAYPGAELVPGMIIGATDAPYFRKRGSVAYGAGIYSPSVTREQFAGRFHGHDERIDVDSLGLSVDFWTHIANTICD